ncbi:MAG: hypothetical protein PVF45_08165 [Anaerolineae bacterium]
MEKRWFFRRRNDKDGILTGEERWRGWQLALIIAQYRPWHKPVWGYWGHLHCIRSAVQVLEIGE